MFASTGTYSHSYAYYLISWQTCVASETLMVNKGFTKLPFPIFNDYLHLICNIMGILTA